MGAGHAHALYMHEHSPVHRLPPEAKLAAAATFVLAVAVTPREAVWAFALDGLVLATVARVARLPARFVAARLLVVLPFVAFAFLIPFIASGPRVEVLGVAVSQEGLWGAWNVIAKASLGATTSIVLAGTTQVQSLLRGMERLRVPPTLASIAMFMVRYLQVITAEFQRMRTAMAARGYAPRWLWQARPIAASAGTLFVRSYERGERVYDAMLARGYTGRMPDWDAPTATGKDWLVAAMLPAAGAATAVAALVLS